MPIDCQGRSGTCIFLGDPGRFLGRLLVPLALVALFDEFLRLLPLAWPRVIFCQILVRLAGAVVGEAVVGGLDEKLSHVVILTTDLDSSFWDENSALASIRMAFEDESILVIVKGFSEELASSKKGVLGQGLEIVLAPASGWSLAPEEIQFFC